MNSNTIYNNLLHIATQICNKRKWRVCKLVEGHDNSVYGTNHNRGKRITIRYKDETGKYFDWAHLVGTLAHELAHNLIDDHSPAFYKLMNEIHDDMEKLDDYEKIYAEMTGSYYNRGFTVVVRSREHSRSNSKLGNGTSSSLNQSSRRKTSIESKEQRRRIMIEAVQRRGLV